MSSRPVTAVDWAGGRGPIAVYEPPHPMALTGAECDAIIADPHHEWKNTGPRVGREIGDPAMRDRVVEPLVVVQYAYRMRTGMKEPPAVSVESTDLPGVSGGHDRTRTCDLHRVMVAL